MRGDGPPAGPGGRGKYAVEHESVVLKSPRCDLPNNQYSLRLYLIRKTNKLAVWQLQYFLKIIIFRVNVTRWRCRTIKPTWNNRNNCAKILGKHIIHQIRYYCITDDRPEIRHSSIEPVPPNINHDDATKWKYFPLYWPLWGETTGYRWIPLTKASDAELWCFLWSALEQTVEQTTETLVIADAVALIMTSL